jgi:hypothetical protein
MTTLEDRIAQAIADPGSVVGRKLGPSWGPGNDGYAENEETVARWSTRAVMALLTESGPDGCPGGYDFTPPAYRYVVHHTAQCRPPTDAAAIERDAAEHAAQLGESAEEYAAG